MDIQKDFKTQLDAIFSFFKEETGAIRGSRPTPALVEDIQVECYGQNMSVKQLGSISIILPREIQISVWDASVVPAIVKAVGEKLGAQAAPEGNTIHVNLPSLTDERRNELIRIIKNKAEETRIKSRTTRDEIKKQIANQEKEGLITQDDKFSIQEDIQKALDTFNKDVDALIEKKIAEINE